MIIVALIVIPCAIASIILGYMAFANLLLGVEWIFAIPLIIGIGTFLMRRPIYEWWISKHPAGLSAKEIDILARHFPYYKRLGAEHKVEFEKRVSVFRDQKKFQMRGAEKVPGDIQLLLSASAIQFTMGFPYQGEFFSKVGAIIMFPRTFITPEMHHQLHAVEVNREQYDCLIIAVNMFVKGLQKPQEYYDSALYGFAKLFKLENNIDDADIPGKAQTLIEELHVMRGFSADYIFKYTGLRDYELFEMCTEHFFAIPQTLQEKLPQVYEYLVGVFKQDPLNYTSPAVQENDYQEVEDVDAEDMDKGKNRKKLS
jgi:Mlc titration factor MtfA (ptsG expression regulator)